MHTEDAPRSAANQTAQTGGCASGAVGSRLVQRRGASLCHCMTCRNAVHGQYCVGAYAMFARDAVQFTGTVQKWQSSPEGRRMSARPADRLRSWST